MRESRAGPTGAGTSILLAVTIIYQYWEMYNKEKAQVWHPHCHTALRQHCQLLSPAVGVGALVRRRAQRTLVCPAWARRWSSM